MTWNAKNAFHGMTSELRAKNFESKKCKKM